ncbi:MAG: 3D domain-containing protein [Candidatus Nealsonbacteria bacterium]|nr:3D domain-containing protein [Candidatus Nealsonbacteria bacterium]
MPKLPKASAVLALSAVFILNFNVFTPKADHALSPEEAVSGIITIEGTSLSPHSPLPEPKIRKTVKVIVTAYSSTIWETDDDPFTTAAGTYVRDGIVANNLLPFGTRIRIPDVYGDKIFVVEDRMNRKKGNYHFDVWFPSYWEAKNFGAKNTYIEILES